MRFGACVSVALGLLACGDARVGSRYVKAVSVSTARGAVISIAASDDLALAGTVLGIPAGSLASDTVVTLERGTVDLAGAPDHAAGSVAVWGPAGLVLSQGAQLTLPYALPTGATPSELFVEEQDPTGAFSSANTGLAVQSAPNLVTLSISSLVSFQPGTHAGCRTILDCSPSDVCLAGVCLPGGLDGGPADGGPVDAGSDGGALDAGCSADCRVTNCGPPTGLCSSGTAVACDRVTGSWFCSSPSDAGSLDGG